MTDTPQERFWSRVEKTPTCWVWTGTTNRENGYGTLHVDGRCRLAHRLSYEWAHDVILARDQILMHSCDNPPCVNPAHLSVGTTQLNRADCVSKGRHTWPIVQFYGQSNPSSKLTDEQRLEIVALDGKVTQYELARRYGVSQPTINRLLKQARVGRLILAAESEAAA